MAFPCRKGCDKVCDTSEKRRDHERKVHSGSRRCVECNITFFSVPSLEAHTRVHRNGDLHFLEKSNAEIPKAIREFSIRQVTDEFKSEFAGVIPFNNEDLFYGKYVIRPQEQYPIAKGAFECVKLYDVAGMSKTYDQSSGSKHNFIRDVHFDFDKQAHPLDYDGTKFQFGHVAAAVNHSKDKKARNRTFVMPNCVPLTQEVNRQVATFEEEGKNLAINNWAVIIITLILLPPKVKIIYLKDSKVPVPDRVGKVFLYRNLDGLHIRGRRSASNYEDEDDDDDTLFPPFTLLQQGGITTDLDKRLIRSINGEPNDEYVAGSENESILPRPTKPFFDYFDGKQMENEIGSIRTRTRQSAAQKRKQGSSSEQKVPPAKKAAKAPTSSSSTSLSTPRSAGPMKDAFDLLMKKKQ